MSDFRLTVGLDWSERYLDACVEDPTGRVLGERRFAQDVPGIAALVAWLVQLEPEPAHVGIGIELKRGSVVAALLEHGFRVAGLNPKQLDRFRDRFTVAGAKDDRRDARAIADSLRTDSRAFQWLDVEDPLIIQIRECTRTHHDLTQVIVADSNRLRDQLLRYFPQAVALADSDLHAAWFLDLICEIPSPQAAAAARPSTVAKVLKRHRIRKLDPESVLSILRQSGLPVMPGVVEAATRTVVLAARRVALAVRQQAENRAHQDSLVAQLEARGTQPGHEGEQRDVQILRSLPGAGRITLATLLAEGWGPLRNREHAALRSLCGVAPVTKRSGKKLTVSMRRSCNPYLRQAIHHMAAAAVIHYPEWKAQYDVLRARGVRACQAYRIIGDRLLRVLVAALKAGEAYDPSRLKNVA